MKCIYWNTQNIKNFNWINDLLLCESPDFLFLSEIEESFLMLNSNLFVGSGYCYVENPGCERIRILKKNKINFELGIQNHYYSVIKVLKKDIYIVSVHLPSQMFQHIDSLKEFIRDFRSEIDLEVGNSIETNILIIGDFNVNPYEKPMIDFDGFNASNSIKSRQTITHLRKRKHTYYNPTWQLYARKYFPGTKSFNRPSGSSNDILEHHYLDQVVISQKLVQNLVFENIKVIEKTHNFEFFNIESNKIQGSDHLPLFYEFKLRE